ncbi:BlaI/MecI/CopY family transcriptional regulator [Gilvimarinus agarilyticus]|uniref:BlaI/MecI/CopY family transcriptional regulator n=1 Tax=Gilvimarinus agarilyticus TaxID=679259 RepID=UPI00059FFDDE|nr:BlaI/MecI/CopY family transcriptional regulator [Gilvimarinus agarilyticus]
MKARSQSNTLPHLGELELALLRALWDVPECDAKSLQRDLADALKSSLNTVQSALERLHRKGLIKRAKRGRAYVYQAELSRGEFLGKLIGKVITQVHSGSMTPILSGFVDFAHEIDHQSLDELERLISKRRDKTEDRKNSDGEKQ